ncbi:MAG: glycosyltransferase family 2 protein [Patescibacteria group bacterium]|nr:glycosyltransferase family 2 protein [Patescibacteria group bacterium]
MFLSIIIPIYNEESRIKPTLEKVLDYFRHAKYDWQIILVNDGSSDQSEQIIKKDIEGFANISLISYAKNQGKGYAVRQGVAAAKGQYILFMDADMSTPIEEISKLLAVIDKYPIIIGSRYLDKGNIIVKQPWIRRLISRLGNKIIKTLLKLPYQDTQCGFKIFANTAAKKIFSRAQINHWGFDIEILAIAKILGYRVKEVAVTWHNDARSKVRAGRDAWHTFQEVIKIRSNIKSGVYNK